MAETHRAPREQRVASEPAASWVKLSPRADSQRAPDPSPVQKPQLDPPQEPATGPVPLISIPEGCSFEGLLTFQGEIQLDGELVGEIIAEGTLRLGATARVRARIEVDELIVAGELVGDVLARRRIELSPSARVSGSIEAPRLSLADGCVFQGRCRCRP